MKKSEQTLVHQAARRLWTPPLPVLSCRDGTSYELPHPYRFAAYGPSALWSAKCLAAGEPLYIPMRGGRPMESTPAHKAERFTAYAKMEAAIRALLEQVALEEAVARGADPAGYARLTRPDRWIPAAELRTCVQLEQRRCQPDLFSGGGGR